MKQIKKQIKSKTLSDVRKVKSEELREKRRVREEAKRAALVSRFRALTTGSTK